MMPGSAPMKRRLTEVDDVTPVAGGRTIYSPYDGRVLLSVKEDELLELIADAPQSTFSGQQGLQTGFSPAATAGTVETYVHHLQRETDMDIVLTVRREDDRLGQP